MLGGHHFSWNNLIVLTCTSTSILSSCKDKAYSTMTTTLFVYLHLFMFDLDIRREALNKMVILLYHPYLFKSSKY